MSAKRIERDLARHAYDGVVERCARLNSFAGNLDKDLEFGDILSRQESLAVDDIIVLSISARRLVSVCGIDLARKDWRVRKRRLGFQDDKVCETALDEYINLGKLFGIIIHSEVLDIVDSDFSAVLKLDATLDTIGVMEWLHRNGQRFGYFKPKMVVRSDRSGFLMFNISDFVSCIDEFLLPEANDICQSGGLFLEDEYRF
mgnify:CR=1 FL=1